jgi:hypothetical protein
VNQIEVGNDAVFDIVVTNTGNQTINDVVVALQSDPGLQHARSNSNSLDQVIGFLNPGQNRKIEGVFRVDREGELNVKATAQSLGQVLATQTASVRGLPATPKRPSLSLQINNDSRQSTIPVGAEVTLSWFVVNTGPVPLRTPVVSMQHSPNLEVTALSQDGNYQFERQLGQWRLADLQPGSRVQLSGRFRGVTAGAQSSVVVAVETADGINDRQTIAIDVGNAPSGSDLLPGNNPNAQPGGSQPGASGQLNKPALSLNDPSEKRLSITIQPVSNSIRTGDVGTYEIRIENLINKPDQRVALSILTPKGTVLKSIRAKDLQYKLSGNDRQIDMEPIKYFRPNDTFSCVVQLRHDEVSSGELIASVTSLGQTIPVTKSLSIQVLPR